MVNAKMTSNVEVPRDIAANDIVQWFSGGWFLWRAKAGDDPIPCQLGDVEGSGAFWVVDSSRNQMKVRDATTILPYWPMCGAVNLIRVKLAAIFNRRQVQQYRRTYNSRCVSLEIPKRGELRAKGHDVGSWNSGTGWVVENLFNPWYPTYEETAALFTEGWGSIAISPQVVVYNDKKPLVYYRGQLVAKIEGRTLLPLHPSMAMRVMKHFNGEVSL